MFAACTLPKESVAQPDQEMEVNTDSKSRHTKWAKGTKYANQGFWEYLPADYAKKDKWPLLIFFHGYGENGTGNAADLDKLLMHGPPNLIQNNQWPVSKETGDAFIVLSSQNFQQCHQPSDIDAFIRWAAANYKVDVSRIYLTGLSCGGIGIWNYLNKHLEDNIVAGIVPIAGNGQNAWRKQGCKLSAIPVWAFHGDADRAVPLSGTEIPLTGLAACKDPKATDIRKIIYPGVGHNSWTKTYDLSAGHDIYAWLLSHQNLEAKL
jgi:predicted peptidase